MAAQKITVEKGKSITTLKGIMKHGDLIDANMLSGGEESFKHLKTKKILVPMPAERKEEPKEAEKK